MDKEVPGADPATFKEVDFYIGQDKHRAYNKGIPTQIKDYSKLTEVGRLMYSDGTNIYDSHLISFLKPMSRLLSIFPTTGTRINRMSGGVPN